MEVADADIQKRIEKPYALVLREGRQDLSCRLEVVSDILRDRQRAQLSGMIEFGYKASELLEIRRFWFVKYNKPVYYQPKEAHEILRNAKGIIIPKEQAPAFLKDLRSLMGRLQTIKPRVVPSCASCLRENRLTVLTRRNAAKVSATEVACITCAQSDLRTDLKSMGVTMSRPMIQHLERQLVRVKSVPRMLELLSPNFDPAQESDLTLFDEVLTADLGKGEKLNSLNLPEDFRNLLLAEGFDRLLPVQEMVIDSGLLKEKHLLIVSSTSSGKTLIGELAGVPKTLNGKKMVYLAPLVALANEKYEVFRKRYKKLGLRVGIKVGMSRLDVGKEAKVIVDTDVRKSDIICGTYEAVDLLFRSGNSSDLGEVGTIIVDEVQMLADPERGPELDGLLSRIRYHSPRAQVLALSATVGSPASLAKDLGLKLVEYYGRPVPLERHLVFARSDDDKRRIIRRLVQQEYRHKSSAGNKGQSIIFTFSRRRAHSISDWLIENGVSATVYHGGLSYYQRRRIENAFSKQRYACVVTTAALGAGVDLPASQVIFESLAMGADWISTAEFEQMLGRAGRLGKHDRGKVYLVVQPERKYHAGQDGYEDEVAANLLRGEIEDVEPFSDTERGSEQILATICSTGLVDLKDIARAYFKMLSVSVPPSDALKHLVRRHMIRVREGGAHPTKLGRATSMSFLTPSQGYEVQKLAGRQDAIDIAIGLQPFENVYLTNKLQAEVNSAFRTFMPTRLFSGVFSDITSLRGSQGAAGRLPKWVFEVFGKWISEFFNCGCKDFPECNHAQVAFGRWIIERRKEGLNPSGIAKKLKDDFELWVYPGDVFSWLDSLIHGLKAVQRIAAVAGETDIGVAIDDQIARIERPLGAKEPPASKEAE
ncbi:MAG: DEAD/DEAH box helicase [Candidatus Thorarchaeota archaeon]|nr:DEAD/DEAH box helicase [Candidatus Thorarchaeota archaeon]